MPFFPRFSYPPTFHEFAPLFRLSEDLAQTYSKFGNEPSFSPNFDIHENENEYILEGELPGLSDKKNLNIEFTDRNNLVVSGKVERSVETGEYLASLENGEARDSEQPTTEEKGKEVEGKEVERQQAGDVSKEKPKYWLSERTVGSFRRTFRFPTPINEEAVQASLENGVLKIVAPKTVPQKKRINIQ
jgi:HSP20 family protein